MQTLANALVAEGKLDEAEKITREALAGLERLLGENHAQTLSSMNTLRTHLVAKNISLSATVSGRGACTRIE